MSSLEVRGNHDGTTPRHQESPMTTEPAGTTTEGQSAASLPEAARRVMLDLGCADRGHGLKSWCVRHHRFFEDGGCPVARGIAVTARSDVPDLTRRLAEAEAKVARVEALADWVAKTDASAVAVEIRAALADPAPVDEAAD